MKRNPKTIMSAIMEYIVLIAPTAGYAIYSYTDTLQYTMCANSKGFFWTLISLAILCAIIYGIFKSRYDEYLKGYYQHKADLKVADNPSELLVKTVAKEEKVVSNITYIPIMFYLLMALAVLSAFRDAIEKLELIIEIIAASVFGKMCLHCLTTHLREVATIKKDGETE